MGRSERVYSTSPCKNENEVNLREFWLATVDSFIHDNSKKPDWFRKGCFDNVPINSYPYV